MPVRRSTPFWAYQSLSCTSALSRGAVPRRYPLDSGGRSYGCSGSAPTSTTRPSYPSARSVSAALAPARPPPTSTTPSGPIMGFRPLGRWTRRSPAGAGEGEELLPGAAVLPQHTAQGRGEGPRAGGADAAQRHAHVLGLDDHADAPRGQVVLQPVGDLLGEPLLHLQVVREQLDHPGELGQPENPAPRQVGHVRGAPEGQQVVLAQ